MSCSAGLFTALPSPLAAIGGVVVDRAPPWFKDFAISAFGTADKTALAVGTALLAGAIGWLAGLVSRGRPAVVPVVFGGFGVLGAVAAFGEPDAEPMAVAAATLVAVASGVVVFLGLARAGRRADPTDGVPGDSSRRRFLGMAGAAGVVALTAGVVGRRLSTSIPAPALVEIGPVRHPAPVPGPEHVFALDGLTPIVVANTDFYRIDTALVVPRSIYRDGLCGWREWWTTR